MKTLSLREGAFRLFRFNVLSFAMRLVSSAVVARVMGPAAMGMWLLLSLLPTYAEGFGRLKTDVAAVYVLGKGRWSVGEVSLALNVIALAAGWLCVAVLLFGEPWIEPWLFGAAGIDKRLYVATALMIPVHFLAMNYAYLLLHFEDVALYNAQAFLRSVFPGGLAATLLLTTSWRLEALVYSLLSGGVAGLCCAAIAVHRRERMQRVRTPGLYPELLGFGRRMYLAGVIEHLNQYLGSLLVGLELATRELAFFRLGQDRLQLLDQVPSAINTLLYPRIARTSASADQAELAMRCVRALAVVLLACSLLGAVLAPLAVRLLYGADYFPMTWSIWILLPGVAALGITSPVTQFFLGTGRPGLIWKLALVPLLLQVALLVPLIRAAGFRGAALAISLSFLVYAVARVNLLARMTGRRVADVIVPRREDFAMVWNFLRERLPLRGLARAGGGR
ncbi:MAG TPA: lipopolysaccharide biosynthesis protein [Steroidobacteraceae bacterium]|nr:lipopolysaccharide biosynthesis protein [Steroidobacteraceae bacterium]